MSASPTTPPFPWASLSSSSGPPSSRRRWDRACDACRRRKVRCAINEGTTRCAFCNDNDQPCTFTTDSEPRKRKSISNGNGEQLHKKRPSAAEGLILGQDVEHSPPALPHTDIHTPHDYAKLEGPSLLKKTLGLQNHRHSCYIGASDEFEPVYLDLLQFHNDEYELPQGALRRVSPHEIFLLRPDHISQNHAEEPSDLDVIQGIVGPYGPALISLYFRIMHPSYPILHKRVFLEKYARSYREFSPPLLAAVYVLALQWWSYDAELASVAAKPDAAKLQRLALKSLDDVTTRPKLSTVQAGLLLAQFVPGDLAPLTARLVAVGQTLGLDRDCTAWRIPRWERGLRRRLAWALYMQDMWVALTHGRTTAIPLERWDVVMVSHEDFPENVNDENDEEGSAEVEKGKLSFTQMIHLTRILAEILKSPYGNDQALRLDNGHDGHAWDSTEVMLQWAKPIQTRLKQWFAQLPEPLRMDDVKLRKLSSTGSLHLAYITTEITLHRRMIRHLTGQLTTVPMTTTSTATSTSAGTAAVSVCREAAKARFAFALRFVTALRPVDLQSFWYFPSQANLALIGSFGLLLWATAVRPSAGGDKDDQAAAEAMAEAAQLLREYRWALRVNAKVADFVAESLERVERLTAVVSG